MEENYFTRLKQLLKDKNMTVNLLLEATGITESQYHSLLRYDNCPRADIAVKISRLLDTTVEYMVTGQDTDNIPSDIMSQVRRLMELDRVRRTPILASVKSQVDFWKGETEVDIIPTGDNDITEEDSKLLNGYHALSDEDRDLVNRLMTALLR